MSKRDGKTTGALTPSTVGCLSPTLVRCLVCEGVDFEDTPLMVESLSKEVQNSSRVLQEKEPGGEEEGWCISEPIRESSHPWCPHPLP